jgi:hypothetical protein
VPEFKNMIVMIQRGFGKAALAAKEAGKAFEMWGQTTYRKVQRYRLQMETADWPPYKRAEALRKLDATYRKRDAIAANHAQGHPSMRGIIRKSNKSRKGW